MRAGQWRIGDLMGATLFFALLLAEARFLPPLLGEPARPAPVAVGAVAWLLALALGLGRRIAARHGFSWRRRCIVRPRGPILGKLYVDPIAMGANALGLATAAAFLALWTLGRGTEAIAAASGLLAGVLAGLTAAGRQAPSIGASNGATAEV